MTDRILIRGKDIGLIIGIITLCTMIWKFSAKPMQWDEAYQDVKEFTPRIEYIEKSQKEDEARNQAQMTYIIKELDSINRKIGRE